MDKIMNEVCVFLADGFEEIEGLTVVDLLRRAGIETRTVSIMGQEEIKGAHGIIVKADSLFENTDFSEVKMLVLPGGMPGTIHLKEHKGLEELILKHNEEKKYLAAICAAPTVFGGMGILKGKKAIVVVGGGSMKRFGFLDKVVSYLQEATCQPAVTDGHITTSRGLGTAIDFALALISELRDKESADTISKQVVYER